MVEILKRKKLIGIVSLAVVILSIFTLVFNNTPSAYAADIPIDFGGTKVSSNSYLPTSYVSNVTVNLNSGGKQIDYWEVIVNGSTFKNSGTISNDVLTLPPIYGSAQTVVNTSLTNPGHMIWRDSAGTIWKTSAGSGDYYMSDYNGTGCVSGGISECPGVFPSSIPSNLQNGGKAVTTATQVASPPDFYFNEADIGGSAATISKSAVNPDSIQIVQSKSVPQTRGVEIVDAGLNSSYKQSGYGYVQVAKYLTSTYNTEGIDYDIIARAPDSGLAGNAEGRNYAMEIQAFWQATTYEYQGIVRVYYKPEYDLSAVSIINTTPAIVGVPTTFELSFSNDLTIDSAFSVTVTDNSGVELFNKRYPTGLSPGTHTETFSHTFLTEGDYQFIFTVDSGNEVQETNESNNSISKWFSVSRQKPTGDFDIVSSNINYREPFDLVPKNFNIPSGCIYKSHVFKLAQTSSWTSPDQINQTQKLTVNYPYPGGSVAVGTVTASMQITATCGTENVTSDWISHSLTVNGPTTNNPPDFEVGWVDPSNPTHPLSRAVQGAKLNLIYIYDPTVPTPNDPDGDTIYWDGFDFSNSSTWGKSIPTNYANQKYDDGYHNIVMDTVGTQTAVGTMHDEFGAAASRTASIDIVPPNPVPVIGCPTEVKSMRTFDMNLFDSSKSYSPLGRNIDHTKDEWTNKQTTYTNSSTSDITEQAALNVYDSAGLKSLAPATCNIIVHPDLPPIAKLDVPPYGVRNQQVEVFNRSFSPDADAIVKAEYKYKYDSNNNGFQDDAWQTITNGDLNSFPFTPTKVGKYLFYVKVTEDYGQSGDTSGTSESSLTLDVMNEAPTVSFDVQGENMQPVVSPPLTIKPSDILNWGLYDTNTNNAIKNHEYAWYLNGGNLSTGLGRETEITYPWTYQYCVNGGCNMTLGSLPMQDTGFGPNSFSPYKATTGTAKAQGPVLFPADSSGNFTTGTPTKLTPIASTWVRTNQKYIFFNTNNTLIALNKSRIPSTSSGYATTFDQYGNASGTWTWSWSGNPYDFGITLNQKSKTVTVPWYEQNDYNTYYQEANSGDYSHETGTIGWNINSDGTPQVEVAGGTIYVIYQWHLPNYVYHIYKSTCSSGCYTWVNEPMYYYANPIYQTEVITYDAFTGKQIADNILNMAATGTPVAKGDHLALINPIGGGTGIQAVEFDRLGNLVTSKTTSWSNLITPVYYSSSYYTSCDYRFSMNPFWRGQDGDLYVYGNYTCTNYDYGNTSTVGPGTSPDQGSYLFKINNDYSLGFKAKLDGFDGVYHYDPWGPDADNNPVLAINPVTREAITRTFTTGAYGSYTTYYNKVNIDTGAVGTWTGTALSESGALHINPDGSYGSNRCESTVSGTCDYYAFEKSNTQMSGSFNIAGSNGEWTTGSIGLSMYVGDGAILNYMHAYSGGGGYSYPNNTPWLWLTQGEISSNPLSRKPAVFGQFVSPTSYDDTTFNFTIKMSHPNLDSNLAGFSFRMADPANRYAVESDGAAFYLSRYIGGSRTVLGSTTWPIDGNSSYNIKVSAVGDQLSVWINGTPIPGMQNITDNTFAKGLMGPFSDKAFVEFGGISVKSTPQSTNQLMAGYAIWEDGTATANVQYSNIAFSDPENDPMAGSYQWKYQHTPKFLNNQGYSIYNNQTLTSELLTFDKVGVYNITLQARDDPYPDLQYKYPDMTFDSYRKASNPFQRTIIVHRRPVAQFTAAQNADGTISYNETSYDPDRFDPSNGSCSPPEAPTKYDYCSNRGVLEREWSYLTPSGNYVMGKLTRPSEIGTYTVYLRVRDEYGAWSYPTQQDVGTTLTAPPNNPPSATLTYPGGTQSSPVLIYTTTPTITWNQTDPDAGTVFQGYHVKILGETGELIAETGETSQNTTANSQAWTVPTDLPVGEKLQVMVRVSDGESWSEWSNIGWIKVNSAPSAVLTNPNGTEYSPNLIIDNRRPTISWLQNDPDTGTVFQSYQLQALDASGNVVYDSGAAAQNTTVTSQSFTVSSDLPTAQNLQVRVKVSDGHLWSPWSNIGWLYIDMTPNAAITDPASADSNNPTITGTEPTITWNQTDPDTGTTFLKYHVQFWNEAGTLKVFDSGEISQETTSTTQSYNVPTELPQGVKLRVKVSVFDGYVWSAWSPEKWIFTNRPPTADFTWLPSPAWEGDNITLTNQSTDPDGNSLTYEWTITDPNTNQTTITTTNASINNSVKGSYTVTLKVTDAYGASATVTKNIFVGDLTISGEVSHTPEWEAKRQEYNASVPSSTRSPSTFWTGERFMLASTANNTGTQTQPTSVVVTLVQKGITVPLSSPNNINWSGSMWQDDFDTIPDGTYTFRFKGTWNNGHTESVDVQVEIKGSIWDVVKTHRIE